MKSKQLITTAMLLLSMLMACKKDEKEVTLPPPSNEGELITTVLLAFKDSSSISNEVITATFRDVDGEGGNNPTQFDTIKLSANKTYFLDLVLLDESKTPADTISNEVEEEKDEHQFFFTPNGATVTISYEDVDHSGTHLPLGLKTKWETTAISNGTVRITLKHQPEGKDGKITTGETDIELDFPIVIK